MTQKTLGYVELEWTCKRCGTKNPGIQKTCSNCGAPMEAGDQFELGEDQKLITDKQKLAEAQKGPDIHCPYCGARNPAGTETCAQCGGNLKEGAARQAGQVLGAHQAGPVPLVACPYCASKIPANAQRCPNCGGDLTKKPASLQAAKAPQKLPMWAIIAGAVLLLVCCGAFAAFGIYSARTKDVRATVQQVSWQRSIDILEQRPAKHSDWQNSLPSGAQNVACSDKYRETSANPAPESTEVCGTPYNVDQGSGAGKVVQDCEYRVYDSYCSYTVTEWQVVSQASAQGSDLQPYWPEMSLAGNQREGDRAEKYLVVFDAGGKTYNYSVSDPTTFARFAPGSQWTLKVNPFGDVRDAVP